jgi:hypothetical protein
MSAPEVDLLGDPVLSFERDAMGFLLDFAKSRKGQSFAAEEVTRAALAAGIAPLDLRQWGSVFTQAAREGQIVRDHAFIYRRVMGNSSVAVGWRAA